MLVVSRWVAGSCTLAMLVAETPDHDCSGVVTAWVFALSQWTGSARVAGYDCVSSEQLAEVRVVDVVREWVTTRRLAWVVMPPLHPTRG